jgi:hypothetical protein
MSEKAEFGACTHLEFSEPLQVLTSEQILRMDRALASVGPSGVVRLVKVEGLLRLIEPLESRDLSSSSGAEERE